MGYKEGGVGESYKIVRYPQKFGASYALLFE